MTRPRRPERPPMTPGVKVWRTFGPLLIVAGFPVLFWTLLVLAATA